MNKDASEGKDASEVNDASELNNDALQMYFSAVNVPTCELKAFPRTIGVTGRKVTVLCMMAFSEPMELFCSKQRC